jgi:hypothetical protein
VCVSSVRSDVRVSVGYVLLCDEPPPMYLLEGVP